MRKRVEVTIETERVLIVSRPGNTLQWCPGCRRWIVPLALDEAALVAGVTSRALFQWIEAGIVHSLETTSGLLRICLESIP